MAESVLNLRALIIGRLPTSVQGCCFFDQLRVRYSLSMLHNVYLDCLWYVNVSIDGCAKMSKVADTAIEMLTCSFSFILLPLYSCLRLALKINRTW